MISTMETLHRPRCLRVTSSTYHRTTRQDKPPDHKCRQPSLWTSTDSPSRSISKTSTSSSSQWAWTTSHSWQTSWSRSTRTSGQAVANHSRWVTHRNIWAVRAALAGQSLRRMQTMELSIVRTGTLSTFRDRLAAAFKLPATKTATLTTWIGTVRVMSCLESSHKTSTKKPMLTNFTVKKMKILTQMASQYLRQMRSKTSLTRSLRSNLKRRLTATKVQWAWHTTKTPKNPHRSVQQLHNNKIASLNAKGKKSRGKRKRSVAQFASKSSGLALKSKLCSADTFSIRVASIAGWSKNFSARTARRRSDCEIELARRRNNQKEYIARSTKISQAQSNCNYILRN